MVLAVLDTIDSADIYLGKYLREEEILYTSLKDKTSVLKALAKALSKVALASHSEIYAALLTREEIVSTDLHIGVALPHALLPDQESFHIAISINTPRIHWSDDDSEPVNIIIALIGPDDQKNLHLQLISHLAIIASSNTRREKLLRAKTPENALSLFIEESD